MRRNAAGFERRPSLPPGAAARPAYSGSVRKISRSSQGATRRMLVVPVTSKGTPAVTTIWSVSVGEAVFARRAGGADHRHLEAVDLGRSRTQCSPQDRRAGAAVPTSGVSAMIGTRGRSRATRQRGGAGLAEAADRLDIGGLGDLARGDDDRVGDGLSARPCAGLDHLAVDVVALDRDRRRCSSSSPPRPDSRPAADSAESITASAPS